ncbi:response regulator transcription factor [Alsobacter sp. R-9]
MSQSPEPASPTRVLVVEDSHSLRLLIANFLTTQGFAVAEATSVVAAQAQLRLFRPHIALLDLTLDDGEGYDLIAAMTRQGVPVMVISSKDTPLDRILCLELGADDFLMKPFELREMLLRIRRLVKLIPADEGGKVPSSVLTFGSFSLDLVERTVTKTSGVTSKLTDAEFRLLRLFVENPQVVLDRKRIGQEIFQRSFMDNSRSIDVLVSKLRKKVDNPNGVSTITNVRSTGYVFSAEAEVHHAGR